MTRGLDIFYSLYYFLLVELMVSGVMMDAGNSLVISFPSTLSRNTCPICLIIDKKFATGFSNRD